MNSWAIAHANLGRSRCGRSCTLDPSSHPWCGATFSANTCHTPRGETTVLVRSVLATEGFFTRDGIGQFGLRWLHILAGITWIGLLYYFNFVQTPAFAAFGDEARARNIAP